MAIGQVQTGTRPGGGISRGTPYRTTPLTPNPVTPLNSGHTRQPTGMNASMGTIRPDRQVRGPGTSPGMSPGAPRKLRPIVADRLRPLQRGPYGPLMPGQQKGPYGPLMPGTGRAYPPGQPQPRGPYSPTPGMSGPNFNPSSGVTAWQQANPQAYMNAANRVQNVNQDSPAYQAWARNNPQWASAMNRQVRPLPSPIPSRGLPQLPINQKPWIPQPPWSGGGDWGRGGGSGPIYGGGGGGSAGGGGGYDGSGINPGGVYNQPAPAPQPAPPTMGINPRVDPSTGETVFW